MENNGFHQINKSNNFKIIIVVGSWNHYNLVRLEPCSSDNELKAIYAKRQEQFSTAICTYIDIMCIAE